MRHLPPLTALRAFEAAARHQSISRAADELHVTQAAVSRQVKALEQHLGLDLFRRSHREVHLTAEGQRLLPVLTGAFDTIADATDRLVRDQGLLRVKARTSFGLMWLIPRLHRFQERHPDIEVRLTTASDEVDFAREDFDLGITFRRDVPLGAPLAYFFLERAVAVCSPSYLAKIGAIETPEDLRRCRLLLNTKDGWDWRVWTQVTGVPDLPLEDGLVFEHDCIAVQAASTGSGVALVAWDFVETELRHGILVTPLSTPPVTTGAYALVIRDTLADAPRVTAFREWLMSEVPAPARYRGFKGKKKALLIDGDR